MCFVNIKPKGRKKVILKIKNFKIQSYQYGYTLAKAKGKQWSTIGYYNSIEQALGSLFDYKVKTETDKFIIDFNNKTDFPVQKANFLQKINCIKQELLGEILNEQC